MMMMMMIIIIKTVKFRSCLTLIASRYNDRLRFQRALQITPLLSKKALKISERLKFHIVLVLQEDTALMKPFLFLPSI